MKKKINDNNDNNTTRRDMRQLRIEKCGGGGAV